MLAGPLNVVVIVADDLGRTDISVYGAQRSMPTPNLEQLASEGIIATQAYASASVCGPSRAGLMTGRYQHRFGFEFNVGDVDDARNEGRGLPDGEVTLGEAMQAGGVATVMIGKWHLGYDAEAFPTNQGYDLFRGFIAGKTSYMDANHPDSIFIPTTETPYPLDREGHKKFIRAPEMVPDDNDDRYLTDVITDETIAYLNAHRNEQFYLHVSYTAPHTPLQTTRQYWDRFPQIAEPNRRAYASMVAALDDGVGRVLQEIDRLGLADDTLVVFTSDNGCAPDSEACPCDDQRGLKGSYYEGGISVPFLVRLPGRLRAGTTYDQPISLLDVFPTALAAAGVAPPPGVVLDGVDLMPHLLGLDPSAPHEALLWRATPRIAARVGDRKALWGTRPGIPPEGYDLAVDPLETTDLLPQQVVPGALDALYQAWAQDMLAPGWPGQLLQDQEQCGEPIDVRL